MTGTSARSAPDGPTAAAAGVGLLALAGVAALLADRMLVGALLVLAAVLAGAGVGALVLALRRGRGRRAVPPALLAALLTTGLLAALVLVPAARGARVPGVAEAFAGPDGTAVVVAPPGAGDRVLTVPGAGTPVLLWRADGQLDLLPGGRVPVLPGEVPSLTADGRWLVLQGPDEARMLPLGPGGTGLAGEEVRVPGRVLAVVEDVVVARVCEDAGCLVEGRDPGAPTRALWQVGAGTPEDPTRDPVPAGTEVAMTGSPDPGIPAEEDPAGQDPADGPRVLPDVAVRFDPAQGWVQVDPATGFSVGRVLAGPQERCRVAVTAADPLAAGGAAPDGSLVLTVCADEAGALTARARTADGAELWASAPSPAGKWRVRIDAGRVLATGTATGTDGEGELVASGVRAAWTAPGGPGLEGVDPFTGRVGLDGATMAVTNAGGQLLGYDTATGENLWTLPQGTATDLRGDVAAGTLAVLTPRERTGPWDPRGAQVLRLVDLRTGEVVLRRDVAGGVSGVRALGGGRALLVTEDGAVLAAP